MNESRREKNIERLRNGGWSIGGHPPYGYVVVNGKLEIEPQHANWVRLMFEMRDAGVSLRAIAEALTKAGVPPPMVRSNGIWGFKTIANILSRRPFYRGETTLLEGSMFIATNARTHWPILKDP